MQSVLQLMSDPDEKINVRLGVGVIMEEHAATVGFERHIPQLLTYLKHEDPRVRQDTCHYLSLTCRVDLIEQIEPLLKDVDIDVREEAEESIETLTGCMSD